MTHSKPFKPAHGNIPIIGQAFVVTGGFSTAVIQCQCEARAPVILIGGSPGMCPACRRAFVVAKFGFDQATGQIQVQVGMVQTPLEASSNGAEAKPS